MQAVLFDGLGQYQAAFATAQGAVESWKELTITTALALVELVTAAARTGRPDIAVEADRRLAEITEASGTDWELGLQARCDALVSDANTAEPHFQAAIDRLARTRVRGELARTHLLYGEWLRRQNQRSQAREQLRKSHEMFTAMGMDGFAERPPRSSARQARPSANAPSKPAVISPRRKRRSSGWSATDCPTPKSRSACSSAAAPLNGI